MLSNIKITWWNIIPDFLVSVIPVVIGVILIVKDFNWLILSLIVILLFLSSAGNGFIRGSFACKHCKQKTLGCPAAELFNEKKNVS
jgi:Co/Zn/Cd efflux system component